MQTPGPASNTSQSVGIIREIATEPGSTMTGRQVEASQAEPRYQVCYKTPEIMVPVGAKLTHAPDRERKDPQELCGEGS